MKERERQTERERETEGQREKMSVGGLQQSEGTIVSVVKPSFERRIFIVQNMTVLCVRGESRVTVEAQGNCPSTGRPNVEKCYLSFFISQSVSNNSYSNLDYYKTQHKTIWKLLCLSVYFAQIHTSTHTHKPLRPPQQ